eukprot:s2027_g11.t1
MEPITEASVAPCAGSYGTKENSTRFGISVSLKPNPVKVRSVQLFDCLLGRQSTTECRCFMPSACRPTKKVFMPPLLSDLMLLLLQGACVLNDNKTLSPCFPSPRTIGGPATLLKPAPELSDRSVGLISPGASLHRLKLEDPGKEPLAKDVIEMRVAAVNNFTNPVIREFQGAHGSRECGEQLIASSTSREFANPAESHDRKYERAIAGQKPLEGQLNRSKEVQPPEAFVEPLTFAVSFRLRSRNRSNPFLVHSGR